MKAWTSADALLLECEFVERWVAWAIADGDGSPSALAASVVRLRAAAGRLADYLHATSDAARLPGPDAGREDRAAPPAGRRRASKG